MFTMKFSGYCPVGPLTLKDSPVAVERTHGGFLAVYDGHCSGIQESIQEAIEIAASEAHDCQVNVTNTRRN